MTASLRYAGLSDVGRVRRRNEDRWWVDSRQGLFLVVDGMGGHARGDLAAETVVEALPPLLEQRFQAPHDWHPPQAAARLRQCLTDLSQRLRQVSREEWGLAGMGAALVLMSIVDDQAWVVHLGDCRAYLLREHALRLLTKDHTIVQLLLDLGEISSSDAGRHPAQGQLTRFVGMEGLPLPEVSRIDLQAGDRFLLCSDGLTRMLDEETLLELFDADGDLDGCCRHLIDEANRVGGKDNITVVLVSHETPLLP